VSTATTTSRTRKKTGPLGAVTAAADEPSSPPLEAVPTPGLPSQIAYLTWVLKTGTIGLCWEELAKQARDENWSHEEYLAALL
jgi:hypothetical protein